MICINCNGEIEIAQDITNETIWKRTQEAMVKDNARFWAYCFDEADDFTTHVPDPLIEVVEAAWKEQHDQELRDRH